MPDDKDSLDVKRNKPLNRTVAVVIFVLLIGLAGATFMTPPPVKKEAGTTAPKYTMATPLKELKDRPPEEQSEVEEVVTATPQHATEIVFNFVNSQDTVPPPENKVDTVLPSLVPSPTPRQTPRRSSSNNAMRQQWMAQQLQAFTSSPKTSNWGSAAETGLSSKQSQDITSPSSQLMEYYRRQMQQDKDAKEQEQMTPHERFFSKNDTTGTLVYTRQNKISRYTVPAGTMIPCILLTGINSDLPGNLTAQVSENVCDWVNPRVVLIPQGTRVFGTYDAKQEFGEKRVQVKWSRLTFPDGSTLNLSGMPTVDKQGYSGLKDQYNAHYNSMLTAAVLVSAFSSLGEAFNNNNKNTVVIGGSSNVSTVESAVAQSVGQMGEKIFSKFVDREPTIVIRPGKTFHIQANADIPFERVWSVL